MADQIGNPIEGFLKDLEEGNQVSRLTVEESLNVDGRINQKMEAFKVKFKDRQARSQMSAAKIILTS
jgi:hypothetical protein